MFGSPYHSKNECLHVMKWQNYLYFRHCKGREDMCQMTTTFEEWWRLGKELEQQEVLEAYLICSKKSFPNVIWTQTDCRSFYFLYCVQLKALFFHLLHFLLPPLLLLPLRFLILEWILSWIFLKSSWNKTPPKNKNICEISDM